MVLGEDPEDQLARFDESLEYPEYCQGEVSEEDKQFMLESYRRDGKEYESFDACYKENGREWNNNQYRKGIIDGIWRSYSTYNPDAKWDWYALGGRWSGLLKLKPGREGVTGESGVGGNVPGIDRAYKGDIDFETMFAEAREQGRKHYREVAKTFEGKIPKLIFPAPDRRMDLSPDADYKALWKQYHNQEGVLLFNEKYPDSMMGPMLDDYQCSEDEFVQRSENGAISTFAYLLDGEWHEQGRMGWFATVSDRSMSQEDWGKHFREMIDALPDDTLISIYDCHI